MGFRFAPRPREFDVTRPCTPRQYDHRARAPVQPRPPPRGPGSVVCLHLPLGEFELAATCLSRPRIELIARGWGGYVTIVARVLGTQEAHRSGHSARRPLVVRLLARTRRGGCARSGRMGSVRPWSAQDPALYEARQRPGLGRSRRGERVPAHRLPVCVGPFEAASR